MKKISSNYNNFGSDYFVGRDGNDPLRQASFRIEREYIHRNLGNDVFTKGIVLDVGCSTGEFIAAMGFNPSNCHGIEVSDFAKKIATQKGISFENGWNKECFYDLVIYRGTLQYIKDPFTSLELAFKALKPGGHIVFLATPNSNSLYYRLFKTLPFLEENLNFYIPSDISLKMNLVNVGLKIKRIDYPYLSSPYSKFLSDHANFLLKLILKKRVHFPFWKNMIWVIAKKPEIDA